MVYLAAHVESVPRASARLSGARGQTCTIIRRIASLRFVPILGAGALWVSLLSGCGNDSPVSPGAKTCAPVSAPTTAELRAGDVFRVNFSVPAGLTNEIVLFSYLALLDSPRRPITHRLYDGTTLLGVQELEDTVAVWKSSTSSYGTPGDTVYGLSSPAVVVDYSSIVSGAIAGRVELSVAGGSVILSSLELATVFFIGPARGDFRETPASITARELCR